MATGGNTEAELDAAFQIIESDLGKDWIQLGLKLGLKYIVIQEILNTREENLMWRSRTVLEKWRQLNGKEATLEELLKALKRAGRKDLADRVKDKYPDLKDTASQLNTDITEQSQHVKTVTSPLSDISVRSSQPKQDSTEESDCLNVGVKELSLPGTSIEVSRSGLAQNATDKSQSVETPPLSGTSIGILRSSPQPKQSCHKLIMASESFKGKENKKVKKKTVKKKKRKRHKRKGYSSDLKFVKCFVKSMQRAKQKGKKCIFIVIETSEGSELEDDSLDLCKEIILKLCKDVEIGDYWSSSICVQMFPKTDESIGELNRYQQSGKLAADLQIEFENIGLNCPLEVDVLSMEELEEEVSEIVEEAMDVFVLSETQETGEESSQTYEELRDAWRDALLRITAWTGDEDKVRTLLQAGVQVNTENSKGETPLWDAVRGGHANIVKLLLQKGADIGAGANTASGIGQTLLQLAAQSGNAEVVGILTQAGADLNTAGVLGRTPLWVAAKRKHAEVVSILIQAGADLNRADKKGKTPLSLAAEKGHAEVVSILAQAGADLNNADDEGRTPLWVAAKRGHVEIVSILTQAGADLNKANSMEETPLWVAAWSKHAEIVRILTQAGANLNKADKMGRTPLLVAADNGHADAVSILAQEGADLNKADDKGRTPLWVAAEKGHAEIVSILIQAGADLNKANRDQKTPLWRAAHHGNMEVVKVLIEAGADISKPDKTGKTPYQVAIEMGHSDVAKVIEDARCKMATGKSADTKLEKAFRIVQKNLGNDWPNLAICLGLSYVEVQQIKREQDLVWQIRTVLVKWRHKEGRRATLEILLTALNETERKDIVDSIEEQL